MELMNQDDKPRMTTLASAMAKLQEDGYTTEFMMKEKGLALKDSEKIYGPEEVKIANFYRFEGDSDPADNAILYAIETDDGLKGLLTDSYGPYADRKVSQFIVEVEEIMKKEHQDTNKLSL
jgi:hypothetical protein